MEKIIFRQTELVDREKERKFIKEWFDTIPSEILWIYGPKSTGKTTIIEYIVENELFDDFKLFKSSKYNVKYINFRRKLFGSYESFVDSLLFVDDGKLDEEFKMSLNLVAFKVELKTHQEIKEKKLDLFDTLFEQLKESPKKNILIFDEIQSLEDIYIDKERELLKEFLNFCASLTKESHISHVVLLSSNTIFINKLYNNSKLKETSYFYKICHFPKEVAVEYLKNNGFNEKEANLIWEYLGGSIFRLKRIVRDKQNNWFDDLEEYLKKQVEIALSEIKMTFREFRKMNKRESIKEFKILAQKIVDKGYFIINDDIEISDFTIEYMTEKEILFFDPLENKITANNQVFFNAFKLLGENE